jgi:8-oxo-dGTP diphosphatase
MSQQDVLRYSAGFLPHLGEARHTPLTDSELKRLYVLTDWRVVLLDERIKEMYQDFPTASLFKALALPYLINISSERALARELKERELLQVLCGFLPGSTPTRATFWHFRRKYSEIYPDLILRVLITMVLSGGRLNFDLPFVKPIPETERPPNGHYSKFVLDTYRLDDYRLEIHIWTTVSETEVQPPIITTGKTWTELRRELQEREARKRQNSLRRGLAVALGLPAEVETELNTNQIFRFVIDKPEWIDANVRGKDPLSSLGPASLRPYVACNVLVVRKRKNRRQVLLSRRLAGYGKGTYTLPGGKQQPNESLQQCAARELLEETGLSILKSRPVSLHTTRLPGKPRVLSVGVLVPAGDYEGKLHHRESDQNTEWQWFDLKELPTPLFEPARIAIFHYVDETYRNLQWSDVESQVAEAQEPPKQLSLPF